MPRDTLRLRYRKNGPGYEADLGAAPDNLVVEATTGEKGLKLRMRAEAADADAAKTLVAGGRGWWNRDSTDSKEAPKEMAELAASLKAVLESVKLSAAGAAVVGEAVVPADLLAGARWYLFGWSEKPSPPSGRDPARVLPDGEKK